MTLLRQLFLALATFGVVHAVHALRRRTSLVFTYAVVAFMAFAAAVTPHTASIQVGGLSLGVASGIFFAAALLGVFLLYVADGPRAGRMGVTVVVGIGLLYAGLSSLLVALSRSSGDPAEMLQAPESLRAYAASVVAAVAALVLLGIVWEWSHRPPLRLPLFLRVLLTLLVVLVGDALIYWPLAWGGEALFAGRFEQSLASRVALALLYAPLVSLYLGFEARRYGLTFSARPILSILTQEDLERELVSARHSLRLGTEALWLSEEQYRRMVDDIPLLVFRFSSEGVVTYANRAACDHYQRRLEDLLGKSVLLPVEKAEAAQAWGQVTALTPTHPTVELTLHTYPAPGRERRVERWVVRGVFSTRGAGVAYQAIGEDVTVQAGQARLLRRLLAAIEQSGDCVAIADAEGRLEYVNSALGRHLRRPGAALLGQKAGAALAELSLRPVGEEMVDALGRDGEWRGRVALRTAAGGARQYQVSVTELEDQGRAGAGYVAVATDVSREVELEAALAQAHRMDALARLAGGVAHDLKNLLAVVGSSTHHLQLELAGEDPGLRERTVEALGDIGQASVRALQLTRQLLAISRQEEVQPRRVDLSQLVEELRPLVRRVLPEAVRVELSCQPQVPVVRVDPGQVERVLMSLVVNARDAMPGGGRLRIATSAACLDEGALRAHPGRQPGRYAVLSVSDTGHGIGEAALPRIFEPFAAAGAAGAPGGLGLSTVHGIVQQAGGHVRVESSPGAGATFLVYLPAFEDGVG
jgi:PAS domain S-box-containing protein